MLYDDFAITITAWQGTSYPITAAVQGLGRVSGTLPAPSSKLTGLLGQVASQAEPAGDLLRGAGVELYRWLMAEPLATQLRKAWARAAQADKGLRIRLSIDPPELAALPWELMRDSERNHDFATKVSTPLVRFLDQTSLFGSLAEQEAELPLNVLLVLPSAPDLDLAKERRVIEEAIGPLNGALKVHVLQGPVTRTALSDTLMAASYHIVHMAGHGAYFPDFAAAGSRQPTPRGAQAGQHYIQLNQPDGTPDWVNEDGLTRLFANHRNLKLVVLNACESGRVDEGAAFRGLAPALVRHGVPAVAAMQYPLSDQAALTFAREFYRQLCTGENAGQVDVAISHARNMLAVIHPQERAFAAPVLYTHAANGLIYTLPREAAVQAVLDPKSEAARLAMLMGSLESSLDFEEDWALADAPALESWRRVLREAERDYTTHLGDESAAAQQAARHGLLLVQSRLAALDEAFARVPH